ncbi:MAG: hypothetical protein M3328_06710 [Chloroflexota bacterium]|nr:hypothetical protein [Chloroflexota bacterium]
MSLRPWIISIAVVCLLLLLAFWLGLYAGSHDWTTPTVPPWPEPPQGVVG